jgi:predicted O-methyltransferase YrrM
MNNLLPDGFIGTHTLLADNWFRFIELNLYNTRPIKYLEIGTFYGANAVSVNNTYASHPKSKIDCIDAWAVYPDYPGTTQAEQNQIYADFQSNLVLASCANKTRVFRGFSVNILPTLMDAAYDIIYVDGNSSPTFIMEDAVLSFRKLAMGGIMVINNFTAKSVEESQWAIDGFIHVFQGKIRVLGVNNTQIFIQKGVYTAI